MSKLIRMLLYAGVESGQKWRAIPHQIAKSHLIIYNVAGHIPMESLPRQTIKDA